MLLDMVFCEALFSSFFPPSARDQSIRVVHPKHFFLSIFFFHEQIFFFFSRKNVERFPLCVVLSDMTAKTDTTAHARNSERMIEE